MSKLTEHSATSPSPKRLRPAGIVEEYCYVENHLGLDTCVVVAARYEGGSGRRLDKDTLFTAVQIVVNTHVVLASRLVPPTHGSDSRPPFWVVLPSIDLNDIVRFLDNDSHGPASIIEAEFKHPFDLNADLPLWRLLVLPDNTVIYAFDHTMGDGQSGLAFHVDLQAALQRLGSPLPPHDGKIVPDHSDSTLTPPLEDLLHLPAPVTRVLWEVFQALNPFARTKQASTWTGSPVLKQPTLSVRVRIMHLSPQETARLTQRCRANRATITGALYTISAHVLSRLLNRGCEGEGQLFKDIVVAVAVSLRRYTGSPPSAISNQASSYGGVHSLPTLPPSTTSVYPPLAAFPWTHAARFSETLKEELPKTPAFIGVFRLLIGRNYESFFRGQLGKKREGTMEISNLGRVPPMAPSASNEARTSTWAIRETVFVQVDGTVGPALKINVTGTPDGGLGVSVAWGKGALDDELAEEFVEAFTSGLKELARADV
ncbi:alcohol acetyltransferase [Lenzites betulinus]|nr:alcohol acetyltransferase [Lenzites betulinus]